MQPRVVVVGGLRRVNQSQVGALRGGARVPLQVISAPGSPSSSYTVPNPDYHPPIRSTHLRLLNARHAQVECTAVRDMLVRGLKTDELGGLTFFFFFFFLDPNPPLASQI